MISISIGGQTFAMANDFDFVTKQIAVGGWVRDAKAMADLKRQGITHILNVDGWDDTTLAARYGIEVCWNPTDDDLTPKSSAFFKSGVEFAKRVLADKNNRLLIHCAAGYHRAPMMTLAILGSMGWKLNDAMRHMKKCRDVAFPNIYIQSVERYLRAMPATTYRDSIRRHQGVK